MLCWVLRVGGGALRCDASYSSCLNPSQKLPYDAITGTFGDGFLVVAFRDDLNRTLDEHVMTKPLNCLDAGWRTLTENIYELARESTVRRRSEAALS